MPSVMERLAGLRVVERVVSEAMALRDREPVKPLRPITVIVEVLDAPAGKLKNVELAETEKSVTETIIATV